MLNGSQYTSLKSEKYFIIFEKVLLKSDWKFKKYYLCLVRIIFEYSFQKTIFLNDTS